MTVIALALILGTLTYQRNAVWANEIVFWQDQTQKAPLKGRGYFHLGEAYGRDHQYLLAAQSYLEALQRTPPEKRNDIYFNNLGTAYADSGQISKAEYWYRRGLETFPNADHLCTNLAILEINRGNSEKAVSLLKKVIASKPKTALPYYELARIYVLGKKYRRAIRLLKKAVARDPFLRPAHELLARLYEHQRVEAETAGTPQTVDTLKEAIRTDPENPFLHIQLGELYRQSEQEDASIDSFKKAIKVAPLSRAGYNALALLYKEKGEDQKAVAVMVEYLKFKKKHKPSFGEN